MIQGTLPEFLRAQLADLHRQETRAREAKRALLRVFLAGAGHDLDALEPDVIDLDTGAYAFRVRTDDVATPPPTAGAATGDG